MRFYNHYVKPLDYPCIYYKDIVFKTGDLLLFRASASSHMWLTGDKFSHVAIIVKINNEPYSLELQPPNVKVTPIYHRLDSYRDGTIYIKQINLQANSDPELLENILLFAKNIKYPETFTELRNTYIKSCVESPWNITNDNDFICGKFVLHVLKQLSILSGKETGICNIGEWLSELEEARPPYKYSDLRQIAFFDEDCLKKRKGFWEVNNIPTTEKSIRNIREFL